MTKQEKSAVIDGLTEQLNQYPHFYLADIEALNAEQTAALRRKCFESNIKLVVVKNTLLTKALEMWIRLMLNWYTYSKARHR